MGILILLCSDGLTNMVHDDELREVVTKHNVETGARELVDLANERGGDDNITLILLKISEG